MKAHPCKTYSLEIESIHVVRGEALTVWLDGAQVELRVHENGRREVFWNDGPLIFGPYSFALWREEALGEDGDE